MATVDMSAETSPIKSSLTFPQHVSADKAIRDASSDAERKLSAADVELWMRVDLYKAIEAYAATNDLDALESEDRRLVDRLLRDLKRNGLHLPEETRKEVQSIKERISDIGTEFSKNLSEEDTKFYFTKEELEGVPAGDLARFPFDDKTGKYELSLAYPVYNAVSHHARNPETRKTMATGFDRRGMKV
eukprot:TRINITY_DN4107_c1_g2_i1.p1 TRINITY_DN4107_c1_g2~~TRINITY_DN4107_c1_g2_i1.p1  ORF type:complete len:188 (+),score=53.30 TRINITY_DN4107_c1_g2_i1:339-902(+)